MSEQLDPVVYGPTGKPEAALMGGLRRFCFSIPRAGQPWSFILPERLPFPIYDPSNEPPPQVTTDHITLRRDMRRRPDSLGVDFEVYSFVDQHSVDRYQSWLNDQKGAGR